MGLLHLLVGGVREGPVLPLDHVGCHGQIDEHVGNHVQPDEGDGVVIERGEGKCEIDWAL